MRKTTYDPTDITTANQTTSTRSTYRSHGTMQTVVGNRKSGGKGGWIVAVILVVILLYKL